MERERLQLEVVAAGQARAADEAHAVALQQGMAKAEKPGQPLRPMPSPYSRGWRGLRRPGQPLRPMPPPCSRGW